LQVKTQHTGHWGLRFDLENYMPIDCEYEAAA
jgi:hypothetical protein